MNLFLCMASALFICINNVKAEYILFKDNEIVTDENDDVLQEFCKLSPWMSWPCLNYLLREKGFEDDKENLISKLESNEPFAVLKFFQEKFKTLTKDESYKIVWIPDTLFQSAAILDGTNKILKDWSVLYASLDIKKAITQAIEDTFKDFSKNSNNELIKETLSNDEEYEKYVLRYKNKFYELKNNEKFLNKPYYYKPKRYKTPYIGVASILNDFGFEPLDYDAKDSIEKMKETEKKIIRECQAIFKDKNNAEKIIWALKLSDNKKALTILSESYLGELNKAIEIEINASRENNFTLFRGSSGFRVAGHGVIDSVNTNIGRYKVYNLPEIKEGKSKNSEIKDKKSESSEIVKKFSDISKWHFSDDMHSGPSMKSLSFGIRILDGSFYEIDDYQVQSVAGARALDFIKHEKNKKGSYYLKIPIIHYLKTPLNKQLIFIPPWDSFVGLWFKGEDHARTKTLFDPTNRILTDGYKGTMPFLMQKTDVSVEVLSSKIDSFIAKYAKNFYEEGNIESRADHQEMISKFQLVSDVYSQKDNLVKSNIHNRPIKTDNIKYLNEEYIKQCIGENAEVYSVNGEKVDSLDYIDWQESLYENNFIIINDNLMFFKKRYSDLKEFATDQGDKLKTLLSGLKKYCNPKSFWFEKSKNTNSRLLAIVGENTFKVNEDDLIKAKELYKSEYEFKLPIINHEEIKYKKYNWICKELQNGELILTCQYEKLKKYFEDSDKPSSPYSSFNDICERGSNEEISAMFEFVSNVIEEARLDRFNLSFDDGKFGSLCLLIKKI